MTPAEASFLCLAALMAGAMNAVAGGGTLITFPALLALGMPAVRANATSTLALLVGIIGSAYAYREHMPAAKSSLMRFGLASAIGGLLGALLLTRTDDALFEQLVPFLLLFATVLFMMQSAFRKLAAAESQGGLHPHAALAIQFAVAVYGGYFGAGIGILMLAVFGLLGMKHIHEMNALKTILGALINLVASIYFVVAGLIAWPEAAVLTVGATCGYFAGARFAQRIPQHRVRQLITLIGLAISAVLFWRQFIAR